MRRATYARYPSDLQQQSSIEDQMRKYHEYGRRQEWVGKRTRPKLALGLV